MFIIFSIHVILLFSIQIVRFKLVFHFVNNTNQIVRQILKVIGRQPATALLWDNTSLARFKLFKRVAFISRNDTSLARFKLIKRVAGFLGWILGIFVGIFCAKLLYFEICRRDFIGNCSHFGRDFLAEFLCKTATPLPPTQSGLGC